MNENRNKGRRKSNNKKGFTNKKNYDTNNDMRSDDVKGNKPTSFNDPAWYGMDSALLRDSASVPFVYPMGAPVSTGLTTKTHMTVPGVCAIELCPTTGYSNDPKSPINIAANSLYTFIRHANSGARNYDSPNLMMYILASADVYSYINMLQRIYGIAMLYNQMNRYIPDALFKAMHVDGKSIRDNLANFRYGINVLINKASSLAVPNSIPLFRRKAFIYSNVYKEGMSIKDQLYMFVPTGFYQYSDPNTLTIRPFLPGELEVDTTPKAVKSRFTTGDHTDMTYSDLISYGEELLNTLFGSEDMGLMNGDILKAYGTAGILQLQELPENFCIDFVFDIAVLEQMKNAYVLDFAYAEVGSPGLDFKAMRRSTWEKTGASVSYNLPFKEVATNAQYGPYIASLPETKDEHNNLGNKWITTQAEVITPDLVMENSRLIPAVMNSKELKPLLAVHAMTEVAVQVDCYQFGSDGVTLLKSSFTGSTITMAATAAFTRDLARLNAFRFHPFMYVTGSTTANNETDTALELFTNIDNYSVCTNEVIYRLNETALMSLLNVPSVAKAY